MPTTCTRMSGDYIKPISSGWGSRTGSWFSSSYIRPVRTSCYSSPFCGSSWWNPFSFSRPRIVAPIFIPSEPSVTLVSSSTASRVASAVEVFFSTALVAGVLALAILTPSCYTQEVCNNIGFGLERCHLEEICHRLF